MISLTAIINTPRSVHASSSRAFYSSCVVPTPPEMSSTIPKAVPKDVSDQGSVFAEWFSFKSTHKRMQRATVMESADYEVSDGAPMRKHAVEVGSRGQWSRIKHHIARFLMCICVGASSALLYSALHYGTEYITGMRVDYLKTLIMSTATTTTKKLLTAWGFSTGLALCMCFLGVACTLYEPSATGSGMPEVISFLNGLVQRRYLTWKTLVFKLLGTMLIVNAGLFSGYDGPFIHLCTISSVLIVRNWKKLPILGKWFYGTEEKIVRSQNILLNNDMMNIKANLRAQTLQQFATVGAASGMASAFQAPVAGAMFALEEAMSFYEPSLIIRSLFACTISLLILSSIKQGHKVDTSQLSIYAANVQCSLQISLQDYVMLAFMGIVAGVVGHYYNVGVAKIRVFRRKFIQPKIWRRFFEVFILVVITTAVVVFIPTLPKFRDCTEFGHSLWHLEHLKGNDCQRTCTAWAEDLKQLAETGSRPLWVDCAEYIGYRLCLDDNVREVLRETAQANYIGINSICGTIPEQDRRTTDVSLIPTDRESLHNVMTEIFVGGDIEHTFPSGLLVDFMPIKRTSQSQAKASTTLSNPSNTSSGTRERRAVMRLDKRSSERPSITPELLDAITKQPDRACYHQMKSLMLNQPEMVLKNLFLRGYHSMYEASTLGVFGILYIILSLATHHISLPTDLVVPTLIIGATFGRLYGVLINVFKAKLVQTLVDPGAYAVLGMAAFWAGTSRMIVTVIMVSIEATYDQTYLPALVVVVLVATGIGNLLGQSQYHMEIEEGGAPFLPFESTHRLHEVTVSEIMVSNPSVLALDDSLIDIIKTIGTTSLEATSAKAHRYAVAHLHNGFPVVFSRPRNVLAGLVLRQQLETALFRRYGQTGDEIINEEESPPFEVKDINSGTQANHLHHPAHTSRSLPSMYNKMSPQSKSLQDLSTSNPGLAASKQGSRSSALPFHDFMNCCPYTVFSDCTASKAYRLFRSLGLRHLIVVDRNNRVLGLLTRWDFAKAMHGHGHESKDGDKEDGTKPRRLSLPPRTLRHATIEASSAPDNNGASAELSTRQHALSRRYPDAETDSEAISRSSRATSPPLSEHDENSRDLSHHSDDEYTQPRQS